MPDEQLPPCRDCGTEDFNGGHVDCMEKKDGVAVRTGVLCFQCHEAEMLMVFAQDRILTTTNTIPAAIASVRIEEGTYEEMFEGEQPLLEALA